MRELEQDYAGQANFVIVSAEQTKRRQDEIDRFGFTEALHGLVVFGPDGEPAATLPGHAFGRPEIEAALVEVL